MDQIKFVVEEPKVLEGVDFKRYDVSVYLNEKRLPHNLFNAVEVLSVYKYRFAEFDMFTCSCGVAGCAGFQTPVIHEVSNEIVTWTFPSGNDYKTEKKVYHFDKQQFNNAFIELNKEMLSLEKKKIIHDTLIRDESIYLSLEEDTEDVPKYEIGMKIKEALKWYENRYEGVQEFKDLLNTKYPEWVKKDFYYTYEGKESKYTYKLSEIVCRLLNEYPKRPNEKKFLKNCEIAVEAILEMLSGNNKKFKELSYESYEKHDMSSHSLISWDIDVSEEDFDFEKIGLVVKD